MKLSVRAGISKNVWCGIIPRWYRRSLLCLVLILLLFMVAFIARTWYNVTFPAQLKSDSTMSPLLRNFLAKYGTYPPGVSEIALQVDPTVYTENKEGYDEVAGKVEESNFIKPKFPSEFVHRGRLRDHWSDLANSPEIREEEMPWKEKYVHGYNRQKQNFPSSSPAVAISDVYFIHTSRSLENQKHAEIANSVNGNLQDGPYKMSSKAPSSTEPQHKSKTLDFPMLKQLSQLREEEGQDDLLRKIAELIRIENRLVLERRDRENRILEKSTKNAKVELESVTNKSSKGGKNLTYNGLPTQRQRRKLEWTKEDSINKRQNNSKNASKELRQDMYMGNMSVTNLSEDTTTESNPLDGKYKDIIILDEYNLLSHKIENFTNSSSKASNKSEITTMKENNVSSNIDQIQTKINASINHTATSLCPTKPILTVQDGGRIGNKLWEYTAVWSLPKAVPGLGRVPYVPRSLYKSLKNIFEGISLPILEDIPENCGIRFAINKSVPLKRWQLRPLGRLPTKYANLSHLVLHRWIVLPEPVLPLITELRNSELKFQPKLISSAQSILRNFTMSWKISSFVGVHVRRADFAKWLPDTFNRSLAGPNYYQKAMEQFRKLLGKPLFVVVSDDPAWCKTELTSNVTDVVVTNNSPEVDLAILAACNHSIVDYGTFGMWGALLAGGDTISLRTDEHIRMSLQELMGWRFMD